VRQWVLPLWLNIDPDLPVQRDFSGSAASLMFFVFALALMFACWRRRPWLGFALAWLVLHLLPLHLFLPRLDIANERQMLLAAWPLYLALATELALWLKARTLRIVSAALLLALSTLTVLRNQVYESEVALWQDTVQKSPHKARAHNNLGYAYLLAQREAEARREFMTALQLDPQDVKARHNLARLNSR
jgi:tetratricopeptide (TPR) repeat protein